MIINDERMIFPFLTEGKPIDFLLGVEKTNKKGNIVRPWVNTILTPHEIRRELRELNLPDNHNKILQSCKLNKNCYSLYGVDYDKIFIEPHNNLADIEFSICDVAVHSFSSGLSFLELHYSVKSRNEAEALNMNYFLSELKANVAFKITRLRWNDESKEKEENTESLCVSQFIKRVLADYEKVCDVDMNENFKSYSSKPVLFSYFLLDSKGCNLSANLGLNMKESYKISEDCIKSTHAFDNSEWYYSLNSVVNISQITDDEATTEFFKTTFVDKVSNLYFFLFLNAVHQRFFLQLCSYRIKTFNYDLSNAKEIKALVDELSEYASRVNKAWLKFFFDRPSSIDHVNTFYAAIRDTFDIPEQVESVKNELIGLTEYTDRKYMLFNERGKLLSTKRKSRFDLITFLVASIISFVSIYDTFLKMLSNFNITLSMSLHIVSAVAFMIVCFIVPTAINFYFSFKGINKINKEIAHVENLICENQNESYF